MCLNLITSGPLVTWNAGGVDGPQIGVGVDPVTGQRALLFTPFRAKLERAVLVFGSIFSSYRWVPVSL